jgi:hypothetical protein
MHRRQRSTSPDRSRNRPRVPSRERRRAVEVNQQHPTSDRSRLDPATSTNRETVRVRRRFTEGADGDSRKPSE